MELALKIIISIFICTSIFSIILSLYDKRAAKMGRRRVAERNLLSLAFFGGALPMLVTMRLIRHKTRHGKFMFGLPLMVLLHALLLITLWIFASS